MSLWLILAISFGTLSDYRLMLSCSCTTYGQLLIVVLCGVNSYVIRRPRWCAPSQRWLARLDRSVNLASMR